MSIKVNLDPLESAATFTYLVCTITYNNSDWAALYHSLGEARRRWGMMSRVLDKSGVTVRDRLIMYKYMVQTVLLYVRKSWVITDAMVKVLEGSHH